MPYFLWRKQKVYRWVCNRNIESGGNKISNGGVGGLWNWRWPLIKCQITYLRSYIEQWWVKGGRGGEEGDKRNRLVHIQQDHIKICVVPQIQKSLGLFSNVIFLSQNFILTSCIANLTWFLAKKSLPYQSILFNGFPRTVIAQAPIYNFSWKEGRLLEEGRLLRNY